MSEYKTIVLLKVMKDMDENHFRTIKSLLRKKLNLTKKMQEDYDRFQIADLMEDKFPNDAGLDTLIEVCQSIEELKGLAKNLKTEKAKVKSQKKEKNKTAGKQDEPSSSKSLPTGVESNKNKASSKKLGRRNIPKEPSKEQGHQHGPKEVMVLKVTEPFTYDLIDNKMMFHATVATETEFFRVKVFNTALKDKFFPKNIIAISDYFGTNGFLEIHSTTSVSDVNVNQMMVISNALKQRASATPKIKDLFSLPKGTYMNGEFVVIKKTERNNFIYYGIEDDTGKMEVVVYGRLTSVRCEPGNKLRLVCFELSSSEDTWQLKSVRHSYMQINYKEALNTLYLLLHINHRLYIILEKMSEYKTIVLLKVMKDMDENHFRTIKSLLRKKLNLTKKMQEDYDRFQIADLMEDKFPNDAGLDTLIEVCQSIEELKGLVKNLKTEKAKAKRKEGEKSNIPARRRGRDEPSSSQPMSTTNEDLEPESGRSTLNSQKNERINEIYYWIGDDTGSMEVVVYGRLTRIRGLEDLDDYQFRTIEGLLRKELRLSKPMQNNYDRIQMADLMEDRFPEDAGLIKTPKNLKTL
ncbi:interferon-activable protein [Cricetulus griseus]|nr:interferon-activable protein [Cricetulus griseus]